jgi:hypothetical protein
LAPASLVLYNNLCQVCEQEHGEVMGLFALRLLLFATACFRCGLLAIVFAGWPIISMAFGCFV